MRHVAETLLPQLLPLLQLERWQVQQGSRSLLTLVLAGRLSLALETAASLKRLLLLTLHALLCLSISQLRGALCRRSQDGLQLLLLIPEANKLHVRKPTQPERAVTRRNIWRP